MQARFVPLMFAAALAGAGLIAWLHLGNESSAARAAAPLSAVAAGTGPASASVLTPYLRFSGQGAVTVKPDTVSVWLGVSATADTSQAALTTASRRMRLVQQRLAALGVAATDMQTSDVSTWQDSSAGGGWQANESLTVTLHDPSRAGALISEANAAGANQVGGPSFSVSDQKAAYAQALARAIADARSKADAVAAQLGVHVTGVVSVDDSAGPPQIYPMGLARAASSAPGVAVPISSGTQDINATVTVVFAYAA